MPDPTKRWRLTPEGGAGPLAATKRMDKDLRFSNAYPPREIARKVEGLGVAKARTDPLTLLVLAVLAGAFISLGALFFIVVVTKSALGFGLTRLFGGTLLVAGAYWVAYLRGERRPNDGSS